MQYYNLFLKKTAVYLYPRMHIENSPDIFSKKEHLHSASFLSEKFHHQQLIINMFCIYYCLKLIVFQTS